MTHNAGRPMPFTGAATRRETGFVAEWHCGTKSAPRTWIGSRGNVDKERSMTEADTGDIRSMP